MTEIGMTGEQLADNDSAALAENDHNNNGEVDLTRKPERPPSAYMYYADAHRAALIQQQRDRVGKVDVGGIMKELGRQWKELSDEDKQPYNDKHNAAKQRYDSIVSQRKLLGLDTDDNTANAALELIIPSHKVKKVMMLDNEIKNISKEALMLVTKLTELFVAQLATRIDTVCQTAGRKTARNIDYAVVLRRDVQYQWLNLSLQTYPAQTSTSQNDDDESDHSDAEHADGAGTTDKQQHAEEHKEADADGAAHTDDKHTTENSTADATEQKENTSPRQRKPNKKLQHCTDLTTLLKSTDAFVSIQPKNKAHKAKAEGVKRKKSDGNADEAADKPAPTKKAKSGKQDGAADKTVQPINNFFKPGSSDAVEVDD